jgi:hypothetical protein
MAFFSFWQVSYEIGCLKSLVSLKYGSNGLNEGVDGGRSIRVFLSVRVTGGRRSLFQECHTYGTPVRVGKAVVLSSAVPMQWSAGDLSPG